jgi:hypothetical protein
MLSGVCDDISLMKLNEVSTPNQLYSSISIILDIRMTTFRNKAHIGEGPIGPRKKSRLLTVCICDESYQQDQCNFQLLCFGEALVESLHSRLEKGMIILLQNYLLKPVNHDYFLSSSASNSTKSVHWTTETSLHTLKDVKVGKFYFQSQAYPLLLQRVEFIESNCSNILQTFR